jgi:hypothetical protein
MKMKSFLIMLALIMLVASLVVVQAFGGKFFGMDSESRDAIVNAIKAKDYNAWKEAMSAELTEEKFNKLVERQITMSERQVQREAMEKVIQEGDYEAWKKTAENSSMNSSMILDEDHFKILVQLNQAKQDGNYTKVRELSEQLGLPGRFEPRGFPDFNPGMNMSNNSRPLGSGHRMHAPFGRGRMI